MEHTPTPTPWHAGGNTFGSCVILGYNDKRIATTHLYDERTRVADAAFIVRACNAWNDPGALSARLAELESEPAPEQARTA